MKSIDWKSAPVVQGPKEQGSGETKRVIPERFFDQFPEVLDTVPPLSGEESMYAQFRQLMNVAKANPDIKKAIDEVAVETVREVIAKFHEWKHNRRPAGNGWNRSTNNAQWGVDCFDRTGTSKSNMFDNKPNETQYFCTDFDSTGEPLQGANSYSLTFFQRPKSANEWLLVADTLQRGTFLLPERSESLLARHQERNADVQRRRLEVVIRGNHEEMMLDALHDSKKLDRWRGFGSNSDDRHGRDI